VVWHVTVGQGEAQLGIKFGKVRVNGQRGVRHLPRPRHSKLSRSTMVCATRSRAF
jgi:predicted DNA-binding WGR domain protein